MFWPVFDWRPVVQALLSTRITEPDDREALLVYWGRLLRITVLHRKFESRSHGPIIRFSGSNCNVWRFFHAFEVRTLCLAYCTSFIFSAILCNRSSRLCSTKGCRESSSLLVQNNMWRCAQICDGFRFNGSKGCSQDLTDFLNGHSVFFALQSAAEKNLLFAGRTQEEIEWKGWHWYCMCLSKEWILRLQRLIIASLVLNNRCGALSAFNRRCELRMSSIRRVCGSRAITQRASQCTW